MDSLARAGSRGHEVELRRSAGEPSSGPEPHAEWPRHIPSSATGKQHQEQTPLKALLLRLLSVLVYYSQLIRLLRYFGRNYAKILLYHSVAEEESPFVKGANVWISSRRFARHLDYLLKHYRVLSLENLTISLKDGKLPERSLVITFDDGFADVFGFAYPMLKRHGLPATVFLTTCSMGSQKPIWIQELCYLMNTFGVEKTVDAIASIVEQPGFRDSIARFSPRGTLQRQAEKFLTYAVDKSERERILASLFQRFGVSRAELLARNSIFLTWNQVTHMHKDGIGFGSHGESHTPFSVMSVDEQREEIFNGKKVLDEKLGQSFVPFSYPFGGMQDFTADTRILTESAGHGCILTATPTLNDRRTSVWELGRIPIGNLPVHRFAFELEKGVFKRLFLRWR